jgi:hypothetical protein
MAFELPVVAFDLREMHVSAGDAALYGKPNDVHGYTEAIVVLIDECRARYAEAFRCAKSVIVPDTPWEGPARCGELHERRTLPRETTVRSKSSYQDPLLAAHMGTGRKMMCDQVGEVTWRRLW